VDENTRIKAIKLEGYFKAVQKAILCWSIFNVGTCLPRMRARKDQRIPCVPTGHSTRDCLLESHEHAGWVPGMERSCYGL
jgi:hypothetical protein